MTATVQAGREHILVVEDDRDLREGLCEALVLEGFDVVSAEHGEAALDHLRTGARPCVILLDLMMPVMDGWTFHREVLKDPALAAIPLVVMTAAGQASAATVTSNAILHKPLDMDTVVEAVQDHCPGGAAALDEPRG